MDDYFVVLILYVYNIGRNRGDRQLVFINKRPVDVPRMQRVINKRYKHVLHTTKFPVLIINVDMKADKYDINIDPNKRAIMFQNEVRFLTDIERVFSEHVYKETEVVLDMKPMDHFFTQTQEQMEVLRQRDNGNIGNIGNVSRNSEEPVRSKHKHKSEPTLRQKNSSMLDELSTTLSVAGTNGGDDPSATLSAAVPFAQTPPSHSSSSCSAFSSSWYPSVLGGHGGEGRSSWSQTVCLCVTSSIV